jgi:hypothetical protein
MASVMVMMPTYVPSGEQCRELARLQASGPLFPSPLSVQPLRDRSDGAADVDDVEEGGNLMRAGGTFVCSYLVESVQPLSPPLTTLSHTTCQLSPAN